jgi:hypothetical protein
MCRVHALDMEEEQLAGRKKIASSFMLLCTAVNECVKCLNL